MLKRTFRAGRRFVRDSNAVAMVELAFAMPLILVLGMYGIEIANLALMNLKVSQIALSAADNASRVGASTTLAYKQLREADLNDILQAARLQGAPIKFSTYGRLVISSLENTQQSYDTTYVQRIHWQRCLGLKNGANFDSMYGTTTASAGTTNTAADAGTPMPTGMGPTTGVVNAPPDSGVMFVQASYLYQPIVASWLVGTPTITYVGSFVVRDKRDLTRIWSTSTATAATCNKYAV